MAPYFYSDYERQLEIDIKFFVDLIARLTSDEKFLNLYAREKVECIWGIFQIFSREYRVPSWAKCLKIGASFKWQSDIEESFNGRLPKSIMDLFIEFAGSHKLPKSAICFERINYQFLHDEYFRCKRCRKSQN